jgi:glycosyltransferase involved in cell wall biosynthesis
MGLFMSAPVLTLIVPVMNEEAAIGTFLGRVVPILEGIAAVGPDGFDILFIDDGSSDSTMAAIRRANAADKRVKAVSLSRNFGKEAALSAGLDFATGDAVIPIDVDLQDPPEVIPEMVAKWREGFEIVYGVRSNRQSDSLGKRLTADLFYRAHNWMSRDKIPEHAGDFRLLDRRVVETIKAMPERTRFMKGLFSWVGFRQTEVCYERSAREEGNSKFSYWRLWTFALDGVTSSSTVPLRIWSYIGGIVALFALGYALIIIFRTLIFGISTPGYASLIVAVLFLGGLQLLSLGILGEYVGRIFVETKNRPIYVVRESVGEIA